MGFHVEIAGEVAPLLRRLRTDPKEIFGAPYAGYLLLLATSVDPALLAFLNELPALDSLTGPYIAFDVFTRQARVRLKVDGSPSTRPPQVLAPLRMSELGSIARLSKRGHFGNLVDGDELDLITEAVDELARGLCVVADLPCVVALDAVPGEQFTVLPLVGPDDVRARLIPLLRKVIGTITNEPSWLGYLAQLEQIRRLRDRLDGALSESRRLDAELAKPPLDEQILDLVGRGARRRLGKLLRENKIMAPTFLAAVEEHRPALVRLSRTLEALDGFSRSAWPLDMLTRPGYVTVFAKYSGELGHSFTQADTDKPDQCVMLRELAGAQLRAMLEEFHLPDVAALTTARRAGLEGERTLAAATEGRVRAELADATRVCVSDEEPRISSVLARIAKAERWNVRFQLMKSVGLEAAKRLADPKLFMGVHA